MNERTNTPMSVGELLGGQSNGRADTPHSPTADIPHELIEEMRHGNPLEGRETCYADPASWFWRCTDCGKIILNLRGLFAKGDLEEEFGDGRLDGYSLLCDCPRATQQREKKASDRRQEEDKQQRLHFTQLLKSSGLQLSWEERKLADWRNKDERMLVSSFGDAIISGTFPGALVIAGDIGAGKSRLASCLAVELVRHEVRVQWESASSVYNELNAARKSFNQTVNDAVDKYARPRVLFLIDVGLESIDAWSVARLHDILKSRCECERPTVITAYCPQGTDIKDRLTPTTWKGEAGDDAMAKAIMRLLKEKGARIYLKKS